MEFLLMALRLPFALPSPHSPSPATRSPAIPRLAALLLLPALFTLTLNTSAQQPAQDSQPVQPATPIPTIKVTSRIVLLDINVTDKKGNPVNNLTRDDFTVFEDKVPQQIRSFELPSAHRMPQTDTAIVHSAADMSKIGNAPSTILVLDELNTSFEDMAYARYCIEKYLDAQTPIMAQPATLLVVTNTNFEVVHDYTQDRESIRTALHKHFPEYPWHMMRSGANSGGAAERMSMSLGSLYQIAKASSGTPGRKTIIWVGRGFPTVDVDQLAAKTADIMQDTMKRMVQTLLESHITLFTIDPTVNTSTVNMMETPEDLQYAEDQNDGQPFDDEVKFSTLAPATGGTALFSRNDIDKEVSASVSQGANYYTLSYNPTNKSDDVYKYRRIRVVLKDPNLFITTRDGYYPRVSDGPNPFESTTPTPAEAKAQLEMDMTTAAMSTMYFGGVPVTAERVSPAAFKLKVPLRGLSWADAANAQHQAEITVIVMAFNAKGKPIGHFGTELVARTAANPANNGEALAAFNVPYTVPDKTTRLRFVVRDAVTGKIGTAEVPNP